MTSWSIAIPARFRDEGLVDIALNCGKALTGDERDVTRRIVRRALVGGFKDAGELLDHVATMTPNERLELINDVRAELGLESTAEVDADEHAREMRRLGPLHNAGFPWLESELPPHLRGMGLGQ